MNTISLIRPDDWHVHLRDREYLATTVPATAQQFARAIVMPNLNPPVTTPKMALNYQQRILDYVPKGLHFQPLMTLYLTEQTTPQEIVTAKKENIVAYKLYPAGVTTHSAHGITNLTKLYPTLEAMEKNNLPLLIHAETTTPNVDIFNREKYFLDHELTDLIKHFPNLRIVVEHISSAYGVEWVQSMPKNIAATITAHHLLLNRNDLLLNGIRPHYYCLPILKTREDQTALIKAATSGNPKFFLGTDSAPHAQLQKETARGCAGIFTAHAALPLYAEVFAGANALDKLEGFASFFGPDFYQLPRNQEKITLTKTMWEVPPLFPFGKEQLIPFRANETVQWKMS